jgi:3-phenylpropionate/cinnamic acid dioxygenase small subunit
MGRLAHPAAWSQAPIWVTSHIVANVVIEEFRSTEVVVRSRFHALELRRDVPRHFAGSYRHWLVEENGDFKIRLQRVDLLNVNGSFDYVIQAWL